MVDKSRAFAIAGFAFSGSAAAFLAVAFASPYWVVTKRSVAPSGFDNMGLWVACFSNYYPINRPVTNRRYEGCWQAISYDMRDLKDHFYPGPIVAVQAMTTVGLLMSLIAVVFNIIYFMHCCAFYWEKLFVLGSTIASFISAILMVVSTMIFGIKVDQDREWLPQPDSLFLSWSFGFAVLASLLNLLSGMCMATDYYRLRLEDRYDRAAAPPPSVKYSAPPPQYSRGGGRRY